MKPALEGVVLFLVLFVAVRLGALRRPGLRHRHFRRGYGCARITCEFFREPDPQLGFLFGGATMGMLLSLPMIAIGALFIRHALRARGGAGMNALEAILREMILESGPISLERYMALALGHPVHGYYRTKVAIGAEGDFITAPEISQMFGELIGLWCVEVWRLMGAPAAFHLVELGPGRGTLMSDAIRAAKVAPDFLAALDVHLVEISLPLRERQRAALEGRGFKVAWHASVADIPPVPRSSSPMNSSTRCRCAITCIGTAAGASGSSASTRRDA